MHPEEAKEMIVEFCGLPAAGKSTGAVNLQLNLESLGLRVKTIEAPGFVSDLGGPHSMRKFLKLVLVASRNSMRYPRITLFLLGRLLLRRNEGFHVAAVRFIITMQYHLNHLTLRSRLARIPRSGCVYIVDGSPWNILVDYPELPIGLFQEYFSKTYPRSGTSAEDFLVLANSNPVDCHLRLLNRKSKFVERFLFEDKEKLLTSAERLLELQNQVSAFGESGLEFLSLDLFANDTRLTHLVLNRYIELEESKIA